VIDIFLVIV